MNETPEQNELNLTGGLQQIIQMELPSDGVVRDFMNEQAAIDYSILHSLRTTGCTHSALAKQSGMNKSQLSMVWSGQRGIPVGRGVQFQRATGSAALTKYYAMNVGMVIKSTHDWGELMRKDREQQREIESLNKRCEELTERLRAYEQVPEIG